MTWQGIEQQRREARGTWKAELDFTKTLLEQCKFRPGPVYKLPKFWKACCPGCSFLLIKTTYDEMTTTWHLFRCSNVRCNYEFASYHYPGMG